MSDRHLPSAPTVVPLDQLLSRRDFCRTACVAGAAALVGLSGCGDDPLVVSTSKQDLAGGKTPEDLAEQSPADMSMQPAQDLSSSDPQDLAQNPDLTPARDMANPNACPPNGVVSSRSKPAGFAMNTATLIEPVPRVVGYFVCRDAGGLYAISANCTHQGTIINSRGNLSDGFRCPNHQSTFDADGGNLTGPVNGGGPIGDLSHYALCVDGNGNVAIATGSIVAANKRYNL